MMLAISLGPDVSAAIWMSISARGVCAIARCAQRAAVFAPTAATMATAIKTTTASTSQR